MPDKPPAKVSSLAEMRPYNISRERFAEMTKQVAQLVKDRGSGWEQREADEQKAQASD